MSNNIKDYREKELKYYVIGNALIIMFLTGVLNTIYATLNGDSSSTLLDLCKEVLSAGIVSSVLYVYVFLLDAIIPGNWKDTLCNLWRKLPGETIFLDIRNEKLKDKRFTRLQVEEKYKEIYKKIEDAKDIEKYEISNSEWYGIYKSCESEPRVFISNRDFLLCRDLCVSTLWIGIVYLVIVFLGFIPLSCDVMAVILVEMVLTNIAMRGKQKRFAVNVIATDIKR